MRRGIPFLLGLLSLSACKSNVVTEQGVLVTVSNPSGVAGIVRLSVTVSNGGTGDTLTFPATAQTTPIVFPTSFSVNVPASRSGEVDMAIRGLNGSGATVANATTFAVLQEGTFVPATAALQPGGMVGTGGASGSGGAVTSDGALGTGGMAGTGGVTGGSVGSGGVSRTDDGGGSGAGGAIASGGVAGAVGAGGSGGALGTGGSVGSGGVAGSDLAGGTVPDAAIASGGFVGAGGAIGNGGAVGAGGRTGAGGGGGTVSDVAIGSGGSPVAGGVTTSGGAIGSGGAPGTGGAVFLGGAPGAGGMGSDAIASSGGVPGTGGMGSDAIASSGGVPGTGGATSSDVPIAPSLGPCDIYQAANSPCVAAHSTIRRLLSTYTGPLYQVRVGGSNTGTGGTTTDIGFGADGFADSAAQDAACGTSACTISTIYDQSGQGNHLAHTLAGGSAKAATDLEADAKALKVTFGGHTVYGLHIHGDPNGIGYRNNNVTGTATGDNPETEYAVMSADYFNGGCCFEYGNMETNTHDNGEGTAEAIYFGNCTFWGKGSGNGPWVMGDLENGLWAGNSTPYAGNTSIPATYTYVTAMLKGGEATSNHWTIKAGNAQSGTLTTMFDGPRPSTRYNPMRKEGAIGLGTGGDNSNGGQGNFFEGVMTATYSTDAADDAVQANIVAAGYGK